MKDLGFHLYIVPTPIGNLDDMSYRAVETLKFVDIILAEDTRSSGLLLKRFEVKTKMWSHYAHNEKNSTKGIIQAIHQGKKIALISDAGTPCISDPGHFLVNEAIKNNFKVTTLPGPTAFVPALVNSGFLSNQFIFEGFLPKKKGRKSRLIMLALESRTMIFYESPHRLKKFLKQAIDIFGENRSVAIVKEVSKLFEKTTISTLSKMLMYFDHHTPKGEYVIVIRGAKNKSKKLTIS